ncbi:sensor histidine kinase [Gordonia humi]|nr:sensor histidine kinase [Gordonia humi]
MSDSSLDPILACMRFGLHALVVGLAAFACTSAYVDSSATAPWILLAGAAFVVVYVVGVRTGCSSGRRPSRAAGIGWLVVLTCLWAVMAMLRPEGAYLVFPLFFVYLRVLPGIGGVGAVLAAAAFVVYALGRHSGFSVGGVVGPLVGAGVALLMGLAYHALVREIRERERLLRELISTRGQLAEVERAQGVLAERARLARDIHDTVAQGLSSIQMLLRAAERDAPETSAAYLAMARETAAESLADTRQIIGELTPSRLDGGLAAALRRLGVEQGERSSVVVDVRAEDRDLPMDVQTALLRIAQGALSNSIRHANARRVEVVLTGDPDSVQLAIRDDGCGFDVDSVDSGTHDLGSFGLLAMRERTEQLGGVFEISAQRSLGTTVTVRVPLCDRRKVVS